LKRVLAMTSRLAFTALTFLWVGAPLAALPGMCAKVQHYTCTYPGGGMCYQDCSGHHCTGDRTGDRVCTWFFTTCCVGGGGGGGNLSTQASTGELEWMSGRVTEGQSASCAP